jgi:hypothetical protein
VHGLLQSDVSSSVDVFAVCLLADSFCHHRFLPEVVISFRSQRALHILCHMVIERLLVRFVLVFLREVVGDIEGALVL